MVRTAAAWAWAGRAVKAPKPRSGAPQAQGLTARTEPTPSSCGRTHAWFIPSRPELVLPVAQPEFKAQARLRHAAATAASPHIRSALEAPGTMIPRARGHRARKSGTILFGGMSQPENFTITTRPSPAGSPVATRAPAGLDEALGLRREHGPLRDHALRHVAPQRHEQLAGQRHDRDPTHAAA